MSYFDSQTFDHLPLNEIELAVLTIESLAGDDAEQRHQMIEGQLGWTIAYYEENVRCLIADERSARFAPGLVDVLVARYPGEPQVRYWPDAEAFTRIDHV